MNKKYLFGMLLSGAMLAACSTDDFDSAKLREVNPSAPVFSVSLVNEGDFQNRATWTESGYKLTWDENDYLSLYHGNTAQTDLTSTRSAIYEPQTGAADGKLDFATTSMVENGYAVMVFPADLTMDWKGVGPVITVSNVQDATTKDKTPYISEILNIKEYGAEDTDENDQAGYGRKYDIVLKRAASLLDLTLNYEDKKIEGVEEPIIVKEVTFDNSDESATGKFTTAIKVKASTTEAASKETYAIWAYASELDVNNIEETGKAATLSTTDIPNKVARFTLLPAKDFEFANGKVIVKTNYGNIEVEGDEWKNPTYDAKSEDENTKKEYWDTKTFTEFLMQSVADSKAGEKSTFAGGYIGKHFTTTLNVDLSKIDMNGMHIEDKNELQTVLKVYKALNEGVDEPAEVEFILDGGKENTDYPGKFMMDETTWKAVEDVLNDEDYNVSFTLCDGPHTCSAVVLVNNGTAVEVPELRFAEGTDATIELVGNWIYDSSDEEESMKKLDNVATLKVTKDAVLTLKNFITSTSEELGIVVENGGTAEVSGLVYLQINSLDNYGKLNITGANYQLAVGNGATLTNHEVQGKDATAWSDAKNGGVINNNGMLAIQSQTTGKIYNYGTINVAEGARTLITSNADSDAKISEAFTNADQVGEEGHNETKTNRFGTINLGSNKAGVNNLTINNGKTKEIENGFIKIKTSQGTSTVANYVVIDNGTTMVEANYIQIATGGNEVIAIDAEPKALIVPEGEKVFVPGNVTVEINTTDGQLYAAGTITYAGTLTYEQGTSDDDTQLKGYFGGSIKDKQHIFSDGD